MISASYAHQAAIQAWRAGLIKKQVPHKKGLNLCAAACHPNRNIEYCVLHGEEVVTFRDQVGNLFKS